MTKAILFAIIITVLSSVQSLKSEKRITEYINKNQDKIDSLRFDTALKEALIIAKENVSSNKFYKKYELTADDSSFHIINNITIGYLFSTEHKHVLIRREFEWCAFIDVFLIKHNDLIPVITCELNDGAYLNDTIKDINGDGQKDFLVHWYPSSGCCRRDIYNVYLLKESEGMFSKEYRFINPTFFPDEKIIRGVGYGHPGEVGLYKYGWTGYNIDTIEYIYPDIRDKGKFIKTSKSRYRPTEEEGIKLNSVPEEYENIQSYDWFIDY